MSLATGSGKFRPLDPNGQDCPTAFLLFNFDIGSSTLKRAHETFLKQGIPSNEHWLFFPLGLWKSRRTVVAEKPFPVADPGLSARPRGLSLSVAGSRAESSQRRKIKAWMQSKNQDTV
jgi:hypothetical protein